MSNKNVRDLTQFPVLKNLNQSEDKSRAVRLAPLEKTKREYTFDDFRDFTQEHGRDLARLGAIGGQKIAEEYIRRNSNYISKAGQQYMSGNIQQALQTMQDQRFWNGLAQNVSKLFAEIAKRL